MRLLLMYNVIICVQVCNGSLIYNLNDKYMSLYISNNHNE